MAGALGEVLSAGHSNDRSGNVAGLVCCQQDIRGGKFSRLTCPSERGVLSELYNFLLRLGWRLQGSPYRPGSYGIDPDSLGAQDSANENVMLLMAALVAA